jgi:hypothetical protein
MQKTFLIIIGRQSSESIIIFNDLDRFFSVRERMSEKKGVPAFGRNLTVLPTTPTTTSCFFILIFFNVTFLKYSFFHIHLYFI